MAKRVLVTGGAGYLGSVLVRKLIAKGYTVRVLDSFIFGEESLAGVSPLSITRGDIRFIPHLVRSVKGVDTVIHLAGFVGDSACSLDPGLTAGQNHLASITLANVARYYHVKRFLFASSCSVYGKRDGVVDEGTRRLKPVSMYAKDKLLTEQVLSKTSSGEFKVTALRLSTLFGMSPRPRFDLAVNIMTARAAIEGGLTVYGGEQHRPFLHVKDAADAFVRILECDDLPSFVYNVGGDDMNHKLMGIGRTIADVTGAGCTVTETKEDNRSYKVGFSRISRDTGFKPAIGIEEGVREITAALADGSVTDYMDPRYSNFRHLADLIME